MKGGDCYGAKTPSEGSTQIGNEGEHEEQDEAESCHPSGGARKAGESQDPGDEGDDDEDDGVVEHISGRSLRWFWRSLCLRP
jgi:hypothetical protein